MTDCKMKMKSPRMTSETKKVDIEIKDLIKMIDNEEEKTKPIYSPEFTLGGIKFSISVYPEVKAKYIGVYLNTQSNEEHTVSCSFKSPLREFEFPRRRRVFDIKNGWGIPGYVSHEDYMSWTNANGDIFKLELTATLHIMEKPLVESQITLRDTESFSTFGRTIMEDDYTADFTIKCATKTFRVHKGVLCARSPVLRAMIRSELKEAKEGEMNIKEIDEGTLDSVITFIYTGELEIAEDIDVLMTAWAGNKYLLPGFMELLCYNLKNKEDLKPRTIADVLIAAYRHDNKQLKSVALEKIRNDRSIVNEEEFRKAMNKADNNVIFDLFDNL